MDYEAITENNSRSIYGFVTLAAQYADELEAEFRQDAEFDTWGAIEWAYEGRLAFADALDRKFNGHLPCCEGCPCG